ncbi:MAG: pseudouridine synthase [Patescibacteria group bacterium]
MRLILQKIIAQSGYTSRRKAEALVRNGRVKVDGRVATIGETADPEQATITINGKLLNAPARRIYIKLNKPTGYTCTNREFVGEKNIFQLAKVQERLFAVGRLDKDSRGLVLLTNDGALAQRLSHPRFQHDKVYEARVKEKLARPEAVAAKLKQGVDIGEGDGVVKAKNVQYLQNNLFIITLNEGKKRQIRRMFQVLGLVVVDLKRIKLAGLELGNLKEGAWANLTPAEIKKLSIN